MAAIQINHTEYTRIHFCYFAKPKLPVQIGAAVNGLKDSLQISDIDIDGYKDITLETSHFQKIKRILGNPKLRAKMLLPVSVFQAYNFDKLVYLNHKDLQGYYFVESIQNYKDAKNPVRVDMLCVDTIGPAIVTAAVSPSAEEVILMEDSGNVLMETGDNILTEV